MGIGGLLAGLVLLMLPARVSWLTAGLLLAAEVVVRATVTGLPSAQAWFGAVLVEHFPGQHVLRPTLRFFGASESQGSSDEP